MTDQAPQVKTDPMDALNAKQRQFVLHYVACGFNATEAARRAGYSEATARQQGHRLLTNVDIRAALDVLLAEQTISKPEVTARLTAHARGDMGDFLRVDEEEVTLTWSLVNVPTNTEGEPDVIGTRLKLAMQREVKPTDMILVTETVKRSTARLDLLAAGEAGKLGLVKKYTIDKDGKVSIELYDAQAALIKLGEAHGIFRDRIADNLDAIAAAARSLDQKLMADVAPGAASELSGAADDGGEGRAPA